MGNRNILGMEALNTQSLQVGVHEHTGFAR